MQASGNTDKRFKMVPWEVYGGDKAYLELGLTQPASYTLSLIHFFLIHLLLIPLLLVCLLHLFLLHCLLHLLLLLHI